MNILLIDDHVVVRDGIKTLLEKEECWQVKAECGSLAVLNSLIDESNIDVAVVDLSLEDGNGLDAIALLKANLPNVKCVILSMYDHIGYITKAIDLGADAYVSKGAATEELVDALRAVTVGEGFLSKTIANKLHFKRNQVLSVLTDRELEMFKHLALGMLPKRVAQITNTMPKTVMVHRTNIYHKLGATSQFDLLKIGLKEGAFDLIDLV